MYKRQLHPPHSTYLTNPFCSTVAPPFVADEAIHVNTCQGDVCDKHFHGMSDVKNNLPLYRVLNKDQAELDAAAALTDSSEWLQHKIETSKQEGGRLAVPELAVQFEERSIGFHKSVIDELSADLVFVKSCVVYEDALRESASRLGVVDGLQLVLSLIHI